MVRPALWRKKEMSTLGASVSILLNERVEAIKG